MIEFEVSQGILTTKAACQNNCDERKESTSTSNAGDSLPFLKNSNIAVCEDGQEVRVNSENDSGCEEGQEVDEGGC